MKMDQEAEFIAWKGGAAAVTLCSQVTADRFIRRLRGRGEASEDDCEADDCEAEMRTHPFKGGVPS